MKTTLILFDIDGTILTSGGAGEVALKLGFFNEFNLTEDLSGIEIAGRTDSSIALQVLRKHFLDPSPENVQRFYSGYLHELTRQLPLRIGRVLPGVMELIQRLQSVPHVAIGLITGNLRQGADLKLQHYGLGGMSS
jgi:phosphoglycolate phosphatase-like HAD superfamily hydrolase